ncbi:hypothetical protein V7S43_019095 [Phytophthora oleae]|uniref:HTH CENPB-type domain-containing protein n=1 Tax=Phytophthora oleae TaxID=2107226 RepID=A0ABD3FYA5_9STRA
MSGWMRIQQKRVLIQKADDCPVMTQVELAAWAKLTLKLKRAPAQTTISNVLKTALIIMSEACGDGKRRKPLKITSLALEERLWEWTEQVEGQNVCLSRKLLKMKAQDLQKELRDAWELKFSDEWLTGFERRHGLRDRQRYGEAASANPTAVHLGRQWLQDLTNLYAPPDIYNMNETSLCYAMASSSSICTRGARGVKKNKTRITLALTANSDGSDALPPLFLGRAKQPYCFKKRTVAQLGFEYKANQKA